MVTGQEVKYTYEQLELGVQHLNEMIPNSVQGILAIGRGGLIPASFLYRLRFYEFFDVVRASSYEGRCQKKVVLDQDLCFHHYEGKHVVVVDDIYDTGATWRVIEAHLQEIPNCSYTLATLVTKQIDPTGKRLYAEWVLANNWVKFPWEGDEE